MDSALATACRPASALIRSPASPSCRFPTDSATRLGHALRDPNLTHVVPLTVAQRAASPSLPSPSDRPVAARRLGFLAPAWIPCTGLSPAIVPSYCRPAIAGLSQLLPAIACTGLSPAICPQLFTTGQAPCHNSRLSADPPSLLVNHPSRIQRRVSQTAPTPNAHRGRRVRANKKMSHGSSFS